MKPDLAQSRDPESLDLLLGNKPCVLRMKLSSTSEGNHFKELKEKKKDKVRIPLGSLTQLAFQWN